MKKKGISENCRSAKKYYTEFQKQKTLINCRLERG